MCKIDKLVPKIRLKGLYKPVKHGKCSSKLISSSLFPSKSAAGSEPEVSFNLCNRNLILKRSFSFFKSLQSKVPRLNRKCLINPGFTYYS